MTADPKSFVIGFLNGTFNRGCGFEVPNVAAATAYPTREEALAVASQLRGATKIFEVPGAPPRRPTKVVGPRWAARGPHPSHPTEGDLATLKVVLNRLRDEAMANHKLEGDTQDPDEREVYALARFGKQAHANVVLKVLKYFGEAALPDPLDLTHMVTK